MSAQTSRESAHILESWWRRLEPRSDAKRLVLVDKLEDRSSDQRPTGGVVGGVTMTWCRERGVDVGWVGVAVVVMRCAVMRAP